MRIGIVELVVIIIVAVAFIKPDKLSEIARSMAKALNEFKNAKDEVKEQIEPITDITDDIKETVTDIKSDVSDSIKK